MGQRGNDAADAALQDAHILLSREECALNMGQRGNDAAVKDAQTEMSKEECAEAWGKRQTLRDCMPEEIVISQLAGTKA